MALTYALSAPHILRHVKFGNRKYLTPAKGKRTHINPLLLMVSHTTSQFEYLFCITKKRKYYKSANGKIHAIFAFRETCATCKFRNMPEIGCFILK